MNLDSSMINGWLNVFKEQGYTSSHIVRTLKKKFNIKKIGHYGTLDPLASGVLPLALGEATKTIKFITSVQLYNSSGDMVAVGNLSTPLKKNFSTEATIKVKLTY